MRVVVQRVQRGQVTVDGKTIAEIRKGVVLLVGIGHGDGESQVEYLASKIASLRIFEDDQGKMNQSLLDVGGAAIVVSQFTLYADSSKGRRPSFTDAAPPEQARPLVDQFARRLIELGIPGITFSFSNRSLSLSRRMWIPSTLR